MLLTLRLVRHAQCRNSLIRALSGAPIRHIQAVKLASRCFASKATQASKSRSAKGLVPTREPPSSTTPSKTPGSLPQATPLKPGAPKPFAEETEEKIPDLPAPKPFRGSGAGIGALATTADGTRYGPQVIIYHAGGGRIFFIVTMKLAAIMLFIGSTFYLAPSFYFMAEDKEWMVPLVLLGGSVPAAVYIFSVFPLVCWVHLALPKWARVSENRLAKYLANLPSSAIVDITTVRWLTRRITRLRVSELYIENQSGHKATTTGVSALPDTFNLRRRIPQEVLNNRQWYQWRPEKGFLVQRTTSKIREQHIWPEILRSIQKGWGVSRDLAGPGSKPMPGGYHGKPAAAKKEP